MRGQKQSKFLPSVENGNRSPRRAFAVFSSALRWSLFLLIGLMVLLQPVSAEETDSGPLLDDEMPVATDEPADPDLNVPVFNVTHTFLSTRLEQLSQKIDSFFGSDRTYEEMTGTYIQAKGSLVYTRGGEFDTESKFRVKVDLPQLEEKVNLVIERDSQEGLGDDSSINLPDSPDDSDTSVALQFMLKERDKWVLSLRPGLRLSNPIKTFIKLRFRRSYPLTEKWLSRGTIEVGYYSDRGWENEWRLDLERAISAADYFRSSSEVLWREDVPGNQLLTETFYLTHRIDRRQLLLFQIGMTAETRPNLRDLSYFSSLAYRRDIHQGWLFLELKPQVIYTRENDFQPDPAVFLTLEVLFGAKYLN